MSGVIDVELEDIRQKLLWKPPSEDATRFLRVFMDQNTRCNLKCVTCGFSDPRVADYRGYDMPMWLYEKVAREVFPRALYVCLSLMSEPLMTRDFTDRLPALERFAVPFSEVTTNGTLITPSVAERLVKSALSRINVSIDAANKKLFEEIRAGARFESVLRNWDLLRRLRGSAATPRLRLNHVLTEMNIGSFDDFLALARELGADQLSVRTVARMSDAPVQESTDERFWGEVREARRRMKDFCVATSIVDSGYLRDRPARLDFLDEEGQPMMCRYPWTTLGIHANGNAFPCFAWTRKPAGNFVSATFDEIWNGEELTATRDEFERVRPGVDCAHCTIRRGADDTNDDIFYRSLMQPAPPEQP
ncbi:MAG TPA: radical SAM protein [Thermoanaerobaculia bacterium]|jgi:MoaA/NifB/PqqE/SkfB family radical SAM enzyme|nr:radical SAM protein [Thermoanaerobaculia bacterium]